MNWLVETIVNRRFTILARYLLTEITRMKNKIRFIRKN